MFTFFGVFADPVSHLARRISETWPDLKPIRIERPISAVAARFGQVHYEPEREDIPEGVLKLTETLSAGNPSARFLLLRTECFGGTCANWGLVFQDGKVIFQAEGKEALRRLIGYWGAELGPEEFFEPLRRDFAWG